MRGQILTGMVAVCVLGLAAAETVIAAEASAIVGKNDPGVFAGPPAPAAPRLRPDVPTPGGPLRVLTVEERVGAARQGELVRVPLFFHEGECADPNALALFAADDAKRERPIPYQADDVRRDPAGRVSRMHLYFITDLTPWQRKPFHLVAGKNPGAGLPAMAVTETAGRVTLAGEDLKVSFWTSGPRAGAIAGIETPLGKVALPDGLAGPRMTLVRQAEDCKVMRSTPVSYADPATLEVRDLRWSAGPLMAKLIVRIGPKGVPDSAEFTYRVPRRGSEFIQTERLLPEEADTPEVVGARDHVLLAGRLVLGDDPSDQQVVAVPAGLRRLTRSTHGYTNAALVNAKAGLSLLAIPYVQTGAAGIKVGDGGEVQVLGATSFKRDPSGNSKTLRAFWGEVRFIFTKAAAEEALWEVSRARFQPLTAVVDEPGLAPADFAAAVTDANKSFWKIPYWGRGWTQNAALYYLDRNEDALKKLLAKSPAEAETSLAYWLPAPKKDTPPEPGKAPPKPDKGRLDPYSITYGASSAVPLAAFIAPSERLDRVCLAIGQAERQLNGKVDAYGFPFLNCFATALNMQTGSYMAGLYAAKKTGDPDLLQYYRDCARTPAILGIYGHGQRTYTGCISGPGASDLLYEALSDHWLRSTELVANEDLWLHPSVYGRYLDCVDVMADLCHRTLGDPGEARPSWWRANMFRGQAHDHRWESWDAAPYAGLHARAGNGGAVGLAEACYFARHRVGRKTNWSELMPLFLADVNLREGLRQYRPEPAPPLPAGVEVKPSGAGNVVTWKAVPGEGILGYRIYRADRMGGPWTLVNSPYTEKPVPPVPGTSFTDAAGKPGQAYFVTAIDAKRRESRWFPDEPLPEPGPEAKAAPRP